MATRAATGVGAGTIITHRWTYGAAVAHLPWGPIACIVVQGRDRVRTLTPPFMLVVADIFRRPLPLALVPILVCLGDGLAPLVLVVPVLVVIVVVPMVPVVGPSALVVVWAPASPIMVALVVVVHHWLVWWFGFSI